ncbi:hypothetical protein C5167_007861 [Papaver somniferum]|uniref:uncharacterized protein LOC113330816 n=1 Tax=Papaver somniferum TaxID=3469 RepID=UPI000E6F9EC7|nr:uncharacterized protein LOC113330816 [Papaver somniferum]RZC87229.1 hypothetical protein C5167_007861 [Papaver somniferum]
MDFRFRPENRNASSPYFFPPNSHNNNYFTEQAMRAGYLNNGIVRTDFFGNSDPVREAIQREIEKERIREEIIAAELIRKRALEAEVRREMAMERELGFPLLSNSLHFQHNNHNLNNQVIDTSSRLQDRFSISLRPEVGSFDRLPFQRHPEAVKITELKPAIPSITGIKRKITAIGVNGFALGSSKKKPQKEWSCALCKVSATSEKGLDAHLQGRKHKAKELGLMRAKGAISLEIEGSGVSKNSDEPDLANASSSSILGHEGKMVPAKKMNDIESVQKDQAANEHKQNDQLQGEKDEDDEAELNMKGVENKDIESSIIFPEKPEGSNINSRCNPIGGKMHIESSMTLQEKPEGSKVNSRCNPVGGKMPARAMKSENNGEATPQKNQNLEDVKKKFKFWCEHCQIGCRNAINMADHENGKKHMAHIQALKQDSGDVKLDVGKNVKAVVQKKQKTEDFKKKFKYWCEQCQVGCKSEKTLVNHEKGKKHMARLRVAKQDVDAVQASEANIGKAEAVEVVNQEATENVYGKEDTPATTTTIAAITDATVEMSNEKVMNNIDGEVDKKREALTTTTTITAITATTSEMPEEGNVGGEVNEQEALADATTMIPVTDATGETSNEELKERAGEEVKEQEILDDIRTMPVITDATCEMSNEELMEIVGLKVHNQEALIAGTTTTTTITDASFEVANDEGMDFLLLEVNGEGEIFELNASAEDVTEAEGK